MSALTSNLGFPRIGEDRELKFAQEWYWSKKPPKPSEIRGILRRLKKLDIPLDGYAAGLRCPEDLQAVARAIRQRAWQTQNDAGIDLIPSNDFSLYDQVLDTSCLVGAVPDRFNHGAGDVPLDTYFAMARGRGNPDEVCCATHAAVSGVVAQGLKKWFDTNYHYRVPEFRRNQTFRLSSQKPFQEFSEALAQDIRTKPVLLGPVSYLLLGQTVGGEFDPLDLLQKLLPVYGEILQKLRTQGAEWVQLDEPYLVSDLTENQQWSFASAYEHLRRAAPDLKILLGTYFGGLRDNLELALALPVDAVHLDAAESPASEIERAVQQIPSETSLSLGVVDGRKIWKNDLNRSLDLLRFAKDKLGPDRLIIAPSSSLLHVPYRADRETTLSPDVRSWLAFAREKLQEVVTLSRALDGDADAVAACEDQSRIMAAKQHHPLVRNESVRRRTAVMEREGVPHRAPVSERRRAQAAALQLPPLPTTTIGSFSQTDEIRKARSENRRGELSDDEYRDFLRAEIADVIRRQEEAGLDVLVHGESERDDMTRYFAERLDGFACPEHDWVQSYGSRCVRPPVNYGDVSRPAPITVEWSRYAQSLTDKPVKGMLTGPMTMLHWSFVRDDIPEQEVCRQIALAIRDEVQELEQAGIRIIQIDEPALREGLPLRADGRDDYLRWTTEAFRATVSGTRPETQIHTHTCYGDVRDILPVLRDLDIDVISIEAACTRLAFLDALDSRELACDFGPGVWDIHSPRVPSVDELVQLIQLARTHMPDERLWINPDCGLKTRTPEEVWTSLQHLVEATRIVRSSVDSNVS